MRRLAEARDWETWRAWNRSKEIKVICSSAKSSASLQRRARLTNKHRLEQLEKMCYHLFSRKQNSTCPFIKRDSQIIFTRYNHDNGDCLNIIFSWVMHNWAAGTLPAAIWGPCDAFSSGSHTSMGEYLCDTACVGKCHHFILGICHLILENKIFCVPSYKTGSIHRYSMDQCWQYWSEIQPCVHKVQDVGWLKSVHVNQAYVW